jgi:hypothetical protein
LLGRQIRGIIELEAFGAAPSTAHRDIARYTLFITPCYIVISIIIKSFVISYIEEHFLYSSSGSSGVYIQYVYYLAGGSIFNNDTSKFHVTIVL